MPEASSTPLARRERWHLVLTIQVTDRGRTGEWSLVCPHHWPEYAGCFVDPDPTPEDASYVISELETELDAYVCEWCSIDAEMADTAGRFVKARGAAD